VVTSCRVTLRGKGERHTYAWIVPSVPGTLCTPPISLPEASQAPRVAGEADGMPSSMLVGRAARPSASQRKSSKKACALRPRCTLVPSLAVCRKASYREQNRPRALVTSSAMERSSPMTCCHFLVEFRHWVAGILARMAWRRSTLWIGNWIVFFTVYRTQPNTVFLVAQVASPFNNFLIDAGSW
jgi:hypothetical protein